MDAKEKFKQSTQTYNNTKRTVTGERKIEEQKKKQDKPKWFCLWFKHWQIAREYYYSLINGNSSAKIDSDLFKMCQWIDCNYRCKNSCTTSLLVTHFVK